MKKVRFTIEKRKTLKEQIVDYLKESIATGEMRPGEKVCETKVAEELGISRTPLREAIQTLEAEGFLKLVPRKGAVVSEYSQKDIQDIYEIKAALEGLAARLATESGSEGYIDKMSAVNDQLREITLSGEKSVSRFFKLHNQFHDIFLKAANNERLYQMNCHLMEPLKRFRLTSIAIPGRFEQSVSTHDEIIEVFRKKDAKKAEELVIKNVLDGGKALLAKLEKGA